MEVVVWVGSPRDINVVAAEATRPVAVEEEEVAVIGQI